MTAEQIVVLALLVAAFVAGWLARGGRSEDGAAAADPGPVPPSSPAGRPDPVRDAARALAFATAAYESAVERWLDERDAITPAGRAAVGELERAVQRLDVAATRLDDADDPRADDALDALDALREAAQRLDAFRQGRPLDAATSRALDAVEDDVARARAAFEGPPA